MGHGWGNVCNNKIPSARSSKGMCAQDVPCAPIHQIAAKRNKRRIKSHHGIQLFGATLDDSWSYSGVTRVRLSREVATAAMPVY